LEDQVWLVGAHGGIERFGQAQRLPALDEGGPTPGVGDGLQVYRRLAQIETSLGIDGQDHLLKPGDQPRLGAKGEGPHPLADGGGRGLVVRAYGVDQRPAPQALFQRQEDSALDQQERVATEHVQKARQQSVGDPTDGAAHALDTDTQPVGGGVDPAQVATPQNADVLLTAARAAYGTHGHEPGGEAVTLLVVVDRTGEVRDDGHHTAFSERCSIVAGDGECVK
jgi:hypothetical protein